MSKIKLALLLMIATISLTTTSAQEIKIKPGNIQMSAGIGLVPTFAADRTQTLVPPVSARVDVVLSNNFSLGLYAAYSSVEGETIYPQAGIAEQFQTDMWITGLRGTAFSNDLNGWRIYGGFMVGYSMPNVEKEVVFLDPDNDRDDTPPSFSRPAENGLLYSGHLGAQYFLNQHLGFYAETGFGISLLNAGITYQF